MDSGLTLAEIGAAIGDPARATMLVALFDGRALTAGELAFRARVAPQTASGHLARLVELRLLAVAKQGRHRYFRLASPLVAQMLESMTAMGKIEAPARTGRSRPQDAALGRARTCYDHLAGRLGVALADTLTARSHVVLAEDGGEVTAGGLAFFAGLGIDIEAARARGRVFCRPCLDWSERRQHIAGAIGAALSARLFGLGWIARQRDTRAVAITPAGEAGLRDVFGLPPMA